MALQSLQRAFETALGSGGHEDPDVVIVILADGSIQALDVESGLTRWTLGTGTPLLDSEGYDDNAGKALDPINSSQRVFAGTDGFLYYYSPDKDRYPAALAFATLLLNLTSSVHSLFLGDFHYIYSYFWISFHSTRCSYGDAPSRTSTRQRHISPAAGSKRVSHASLSLWRSSLISHRALLTTVRL